MRQYEIAYIVHPDLDADAFAGIQERVSGWVTDSGGAVVNTDIWGKRKLAYEIRKQKEGQYVVINAELDPAATADLERNLRLQESVMRFMIIADDTPPPAK
jgi:small subunit ribosomal protein S6